VKKPAFSVARFRNRNGSHSWRVSGWLYGLRIRKNFKSREEAAAEKSALELKALQANSGLRLAPTFLTDDQLREAEIAFRRIGGQPHSLLFYLERAVANFREPERDPQLADAVTQYVAAKATEHDRALLSIRQYRSIKDELATFTGWFPSSPLSQITPANLVAYLERGGASPKAHNNRRGLLSTFFKFTVQKDWIATNPIAKIPYHRIAHRRGSATTLTAERASELMAYVEEFQDGRLVPYYSLCLFAGVRPCPVFGEISKLRPEHVHLDTGMIMIEPEVSKVRTKRAVAIQPNLRAWLGAYPLEEFPIIPENAAKDRLKVYKKFGLTHDVLRHSFISMFIAKFRSLGEAALQAGNSESIIRRHYLDLKSKDEAERFFGILPKSGGPNQGTFDI
jgi:integrase